MSDIIGRWIPGLDPSTGTLTLPLWSAGALAALLVVFCVLAFSRAGRDGVAGGLARVLLVLIGAVGTLYFLNGTVRQDLAAERRALAARLDLLASQAHRPGSSLACLDAMAGELVEGSCERSLFASPEGMASAVSYVEQQLALVADLNDFASRSKVDMEPGLAVLRRGLETDRFGLVAHVLATRDGCTPERCDTAALLQDARRVTANLAKRTYEFYVARHSQVWPQPAPGPTASAVPGSANGTIPALPPSATAYANPRSNLRPAGPDVFFPSASSIPPVNIMTAEPASVPETTGRTPPRRGPAPQQHSQQAPQPSQPPMDLNSAARSVPVTAQ